MYIQDVQKLYSFVQYFNVFLVENMGAFLYPGKYLLVLKSIMIRLKQFVITYLMGGWPPKENEKV